ncbi:hypothetical protein [Streptomyces coffeae]|uniref:DUF320 domain-containing protein n=1 Tax=Streptomyces coffeae TaxID=621382 RepID=A0ABS1NDM9_9ACTN|nr:hypothetical protein [Streptomyces coffeae]MBL1098005.1 hypothetical protein [Streptomyces coffeae]
MNIGKTAALVTATAGAVMFGGGQAALADPVNQSNECDTATASTLPLSADGVEAGANCLNFAHIFGDPKSVTQKNHCDSSGPSNNANVVIVPIGDGSCSNIAIGNDSSKAAKARYGSSSTTATGAR